MMKVGTLIIQSLNKYLEALKFWNGQPYDKSGFVVASIHFLLVTISINAPAIGIILGWDPPYYIFHSRFPNFSQTHKFLYAIQLIVRYIYLAWCIIEGGRIYATVIPPSILFCYICFTCVCNMCKRSLNNSTLFLYHQLHCILQTAMDFISLAAGALLAVGLILSVLLNWAVISAWNKVPAGIYFLAVMLDIVICSIISVMLPLAIKSNELSELLLCSWRKHLAVVAIKRRYWKKVVKAERPMAIYYASTKFEKDTRANYYSTIVAYTVNLLLVSA